MSMSSRLAGAVICLMLLVTLAEAKDSKSPSLPSIESILAQDFEVSIITESYGAFNASLIVRGSLNFPERLHGELIPHGEAKLEVAGQKALPHFARERVLADDQLSGIHDIMTTATSSSEGEDNKENNKDRRPTLLSFDVKLQHPNSPRGRIQLYFLPADLAGLKTMTDLIQEGSAKPSATSDFAFRAERAAVASSPMSDIPALARVASSSLKLAAKGDGGSSTEGDFTLRLFSDHEFSIAAHIPKAGGGEERVWVHAYAPSSHTRGEVEKPWWQIPLMIGVGLLTFLVQVLSGTADGKKKAMSNESSGQIENAAAGKSKKKQ